MLYEVITNVSGSEITNGVNITGTVSGELNSDPTKNIVTLTVNGNDYQGQVIGNGFNIHVSGRNNFV